MKGWIEIHELDRNSADVRMRCFQISHLRWIGPDLKHRGRAAIQTVDDEFILTVRESYEELRKQIETAQ